MAEWGKLYGSLHGSPKWRRTSRGARALWVTAMSWCVEQDGSDGCVPTDMLRYLDGTPQMAANLVENSLWIATKGGWKFHDWEHYQRTRQQVERDKNAAKERQKRARDKRNGAGQSDSEGPRHGVTLTDESRVSHAVSHAARGEKSREEESKDSSSEIAGAIQDAPIREDVEAVCARMVERVTANGVKAPTITKAWRNSARLLIDNDGHTVEQIIWLIDWATADEFWKSNILSVPKLREKFDQLRIKATGNGATKAPSAPIVQAWMHR